MSIHYKIYNQTKHGISLYTKHSPQAKVCMSRYHTWNSTVDGLQLCNRSGQSNYKISNAQIKALKQYIWNNHIILISLNHEDHHIKKYYYKCVFYVCPTWKSLSVYWTQKILIANFYLKYREFPGSHSYQRKLLI